MCSACITISPRGVEQRGRGVAALLDVGRVRRADQHRAHLLADRAQRAGQDLELDRVDRRRSLRRVRWIVPVSSTSPAQPGGTSSVDSGSSTTAGPASVGARRRGAAQHLELDRSPSSVAARAARSQSGSSGVAARARASTSAPGVARHADRDQLELLLGVAVAVALLVLGLERLAQLARASGRRTGGDRRARTPGRGSAARRRRCSSASGSPQRRAGPLAELVDALARSRSAVERARRSAARCAGRRAGAARRPARAPRARPRRAGRRSRRSRARRRSRRRAAARRRRTPAARSGADRSRAAR